MMRVRPISLGERIRGNLADTTDAPRPESSTPPTQSGGGVTTDSNSTAPPTPTFPPDSTGKQGRLADGLDHRDLGSGALDRFHRHLTPLVALHTGTIHGGPDLYYNFWSGFGSDLGEATLISAVSVGVYTGVRKVNCHTKGRWRIGHHALDGTPYILCKHHHPEVPNHGATHEHILAQHHKFKLEQGSHLTPSIKSIRVRGWVARSAAGAATSRRTGAFSPLPDPEHRPNCRDADLHP